MLQSLGVTDVQNMESQTERTLAEIEKVAKNWDQ
jgi:hypothetical protein